MALITKPNTFSPSTTISSSEMNDNFDTIYNAFNGGIDTTNMTSTALDSYLDKTSTQTATGAKTFNNLIVGSSGTFTGNGKVDTEALADASGTPAKWTNDVAFRAYGNQTVAINTDTKATLTTVDFDRGSNFDNTNYKFTAPYNCVMHFDFTARWTPASFSGKVGSLQLRINGSQATGENSNSSMNFGGTNTNTNHSSGDWKLNSGDVVTLNVNENAGTLAVYCELSGHLVTKL